VSSLSGSFVWVMYWGFSLVEVSLRCRMLFSAFVVFSGNVNMAVSDKF